MSARSTEESESGLWPTANVAGGGNPPDRLTKIGNQYFRPSGEKAHLGWIKTADMGDPAEDGERGQGLDVRRADGGGADWATPQAGDEKAAVNVTTQNQRMLSHDALAFSRGPTPSPFADMTTPSGVSRVTRRKMGLNPEFTRWLMGYPLAWLSCVARQRHRPAVRVRNLPRHRSARRTGSRMTDTPILDPIALFGQGCSSRSSSAASSRRCAVRSAYLAERSAANQKPSGRRRCHSAACAARIGC